MQINNKLREALEALNRIDTRGLKRLLCELVESDIFDGGQINKTISAVDKAKAALSAPPRNCDVPLVVDGPADNNADKAWLVFKQHNPDAYFDVPGLLRCIDWLLAPATEKEGCGR